jgi:hypothetical protein
MNYYLYFRLFRRQHHRQLLLCIVSLVIMRVPSRQNLSHLMIQSSMQNDNRLPLQQHRCDFRRRHHQQLQQSMQL